MRAALAMAGGLAALAACGLAGPDGEPPEPAPLAGLSCRAVPVPAGPEDIVVDHERGLAYVASTDRRALEDGAEGQRIGFLTRLDLRTAMPEAVDVTPGGLRGPDFRPHGIGLLPGERPLLFVVDRRPPPPGAASCMVDNAVRVLAVEGDRLRPVRTVDDPESLIRLNDVEPLDEHRFFATNDHGTRSCLGRNLRDLFGLNRGHLLVFDGERFRVAAADLPFANGLALDRERGLLHVAASGDGTIRRFVIEGSGLNAVGRADLDRSPDNLSVGPDGRLLVAAHPDRVRFLHYQRGWLGVETAPTSILEIGPEGGVREIFADDGRTIAAASVAARFFWEERGLERLLIGQVYGAEVLLCDRPLHGSEAEPGSPGFAGPEKKAAPDGSGAAGRSQGGKEQQGRQDLPGG